MTLAPFNAIKACRHGDMLLNVNDNCIGLSLRLYGEWCEGEIDLLCKIARPGDIVIDAGAHIGTHTLPLAQRVGPQGAVLAFEPQRLIYQTLCANVALNNLTNVHCYHAALGDTHRMVNVPVCDPRQSLNFGSVWVNTESGERVPMLTIDSLSDSGKCRLVKADIEGMEMLLLAGAQRTIERLAPVLYLENDKPGAAALIDCAHRLGYRTYWHRTPVYSLQNFAQNPTNVFGEQRSVNMLCVRDGTPDMPALDGLEEARA